MAKDVRYGNLRQRARGVAGPSSFTVRRDLRGHILFKEREFRWQVGEGTLQKVRVAQPVPACPLATSLSAWLTSEAQEGSR